MKRLCILLMFFSLHSFAQGLVAGKGNIFFENGQPAQLRGISLSWSIWGGAKYYNANVVNTLIDDFKSNVIRVSMAVEPTDGYLHNPKLQWDRIIPVVDQALKKGIYVIIDWHDHHADKNFAAAKEFFELFSKKYAHSPFIIYEIWNEPERVEWEVVKKYAQEVIPVIRKNDPKNLILVGSPHWDQDIDVVAQDPLNGFENIAYTFHFYASDPNHQEKLRNRATEAIESGLPVFVSEWGVGESNGDGIFNLEKNQAWIDWMEKYQLSWANWNVTDKKETTAILNPGAPGNGKWTEKHLSPAGQFIKRILNQLNPK